MPLFCSKAMISQIIILQPSDDILDHYLISCILNLAMVAKSTLCDKYARTINSNTKDCFINNLPDHLLSIPVGLEELELATETFDFLFSRPLNTVALSCFKKIK